MGEIKILIYFHENSFLFGVMVFFFYFQSHAFYLRLTYELLYEDSTFQKMDTTWRVSIKNQIRRNVRSTAEICYRKCHLDWSLLIMQINDYRLRLGYSGEFINVQKLLFHRVTYCFRLVLQIYHFLAVNAKPSPVIFQTNFQHPTESTVVTTV